LLLLSLGARSHGHTFYISQLSKSATTFADFYHGLLDHPTRCPVLQL
jgi:hypothetical protein